MEDVRILTPEAENDQPTRHHMEALRAALLLVPPFHRRVIRQVEMRGRRQHPHVGGGNDADARIIRLSRVCLERSYNDHYNSTFLHELGHIVDHYYGVTSYIRGLRTDQSRAFIATEHSHRDGGTDGPGERSADCYMYYLTTVVGDRNTMNRWYRGAEGEMRFQLLLASPAFSNEDGSPRTS